MGYSLASNIITQTGTDADLSGLSSIAGVTTFTYGSGDTLRTFYNIGDRELRIEGTQTITGKRERLVVDNNARPTAVRIVSGGTLNIDGTISYANGSQDILEVVIEGLKKADALGGGTIYTVFVQSGGTLNMDNCAVLSASGNRFDTGSTVTVNNGAFILRDETPVQGQQQQFFNAPTINGLLVLGHKGSFRGNVDDITGFSPRFGDLGIGYTSTTDNASVRLHRFFDYNPIDMTTDVGQYGNAGGKGSRFVNASKGTGLSMRLENSNGGVSEVYKTFRITITDTSGSPIQDALFFIRDVDNGNRSTIYGRNYNPDRTYSGLTDVNGQVVEDTDQNGLFTGVRFALNAWDRRSKSNNSDDEFDVPLWSYAHVSFVLADIQMKGTGRLELAATLLDDQNITETNRATVQAYTAIDDLDRLYDRAKDYKVDVANVEYPTVTTQVLDALGNVVLLGDRSLDVNPAAGPAFAVDTGTDTITIDASVLDSTANKNEINSENVGSTVRVRSGADVSANITGNAQIDAGGTMSGTLFVTSGRSATCDEVTDLTGSIAIAGTLTTTGSTGGQLPEGDVFPSGRIVTGGTGGRSITATNVTFAPGSIIENTSGSPVIVIFRPGQARPTAVETSGTLVFINEPVPVTITVLDVSGAPIQGARVFLEETVSGFDIINDLTNASGQVTVDFAYDVADVAVTGRARRGTTSPRYKTADITGTITTAGFSTTVVMVLDE